MQRYLRQCGGRSLVDPVAVRYSVKMPLLDPTPRLANDPKSVKINLTAGTGMEIEWKDGHRSSYTFPFLRDACPCALCDDEREIGRASCRERV